MIGLVILVMIRYSHSTTIRYHLKFFTVVIFLVVSKMCLANFYIDANGGSDTTDGKSPTSAWASIQQLNKSWHLLQPGDSILFKRGQIFFGGIIASGSGSSLQPIVISAYGNGAEPIISGLATVTNWMNKGNGIWSAKISSASKALIIVAINGQLQRMGRFPNANSVNGGYLTSSTSDPNKSSITATLLSNNITWKGAEIVIRKNHWIIDRCLVVQQNGATIFYKNPPESNYACESKSGFFFQNSISTLDLFGEWYFNEQEQNLSIYFGTKKPNAFHVKAAVVNRLLDLGAANHFVIKDLSFEGANEDAVYNQYGADITITNCIFNNNYNAINLDIVKGSLTDGNQIFNTLNTGIQQLGYPVGHVFTTRIINNKIRNVGMFAGMSGSGDGMLNGIRQSGNNAMIDGNRVDSSGYQGIVFEGDSTIVQQNFITNFCSIKDDGAGIYSQSLGGKISNTNRIVANNIILHGIGARAGTEAAFKPENADDAHGIYMDDGANAVDIHHNTVAWMPNGSGIVGNVAYNLLVRNNIFYKVRIGCRLSRMPNKLLIRKIQFVKNIVYADKSNFAYWNGSLYYPVSTSIQTDMRSVFTLLDSNFYRNDIATPFDYLYHLTKNGTYVKPAAMNFADWKKYITMDVNSNIIGKVGIDFQYNPSSKPLKYSFMGKRKKDLSGKLFQDKAIILPFSSILFFDVVPQ